MNRRWLVLVVIAGLMFPGILLGVAAFMLTRGLRRVQ